MFEFKVLLPNAIIVHAPLGMEEDDIEVALPLGLHTGHYVLKKSLQDFFALSNHLSSKYGS
jgi:hypothetical protein